MSNRLLALATTAMLIGAPLAAHAQGSGAAPGAVSGAVTGAVVGGPVGAVVGGVAGAAIGGALTADESTRVRQYVVRERRPSVRVQERVAVGETLPPSVQYYEVPADVGVRTEYRYSVVNDRTVLVDPRTRRVIQVIE